MGFIFIGHPVGTKAVYGSQYQVHHCNGNWWTSFISQILL